jgi:phosphonate dehydrogenase
MKIVATNRVFPETRALLPSGATLIAPEGDAPLSREAAASAAADADALMAFMTDRIDAAFLAACPRLRIVGAALKGHDNIDLAAAREAGVWVSIVEDLLTGPTAELAIALMLTLGRHVIAADAELRRDGFHGWRPRHYGRGLAGETVGLLGYGAVGRAIARRLGGFDCRLLACDRIAPSDGLVEPVGLEALLTQSDWLVLALPLTPETTGVIDAAALARLKPGAMLVNPARGSLVDEAAVADALDAGRLGGYATDVFE